MKIRHIIEHLQQLEPEADIAAFIDRSQNIERSATAGVTESGQLYITNCPGPKGELPPFWMRLGYWFNRLPLTRKVG